MSALLFACLFPRMHCCLCRVCVVTGRSAPWGPCSPPVAETWRTTDAAIGATSTVVTGGCIILYVIYRHTTTNAFLRWLRLLLRRPTGRASFTVRDYSSASSLSRCLEGALYKYLITLQCITSFPCIALYWPIVYILFIYPIAWPSVRRDSWEMFEGLRSNE